MAICAATLPAAPGLPDQIKERIGGSDVVGEQAIECFPDEARFRFPASRRHFLQQTILLRGQQDLDPRHVCSHESILHNLKNRRNLSPHWASPGGRASSEPCAQ